MKRKFSVNKFPRTTIKKLLLGAFDPEDYDRLEKQLIRVFKDWLGLRGLEEWQLLNIKDMVDSMKTINDKSYQMMDV